MQEDVTRRTFHKTGMTMLGSLSLSGLHLSHAAEEPSDPNRLLRLGLNALARAPERNYFADGHRGAALISAHLMCAENNFAPAIRQRITTLFDSNWASTPLCAPFPQTPVVHDAVGQIGEALAKGAGVLREVGHDAIFAMHAIKAIRALPDLATAARVNGICNLLQSIKPWRDIAPDPRIDVPPPTDGVAFSRFVLSEASNAIDRFVGFGQGFTGHMLTFGQAILELAEMGDTAWATSCTVAFQKYVTVTRLGPQPNDRRFKDHRFSELRPRDLKYWQNRHKRSLGIGHVFKYPYAYYDLLAKAASPQLEQEWEAKAWHLF